MIIQLTFSLNERDGAPIRYLTSQALYKLLTAQQNNLPLGTLPYCLAYAAPT
jgi:hypothetical protein